ncbi:carboxypeptidase-like regulatory domain-containing protein [candidate division WOR-3 bacterium]|nr:carboxypeptidase-like regulatory domain-containing protein [candidate division WOR-3 bacterium]
MKKLLFISLSLLLLSPTAFSEPGFDISPASIANSGFLRLEPATGIPQGNFSIGLALRGFNYDPEEETQTYRGGSLTLGLDYGIVDNLSARLWMPFYLDIKTNWSCRDIGFGDVGIGLKYSINDILSIEPYIITPLGKGILGPEEGEGQFRSFTTGRVDLGVKTALSYKIQDIRFTAGGAYIYHGLDDKYIGQFGVCYELGEFRPFIEVIGEDRAGFNTDDSEKYGSDIMYLTPGLVYNPFSNLSLLFAVDIRISWEEYFGGTHPTDWISDNYITAGPGRSQPWAITLGAKYTLGKPIIDKTMLVGEIIDSETGKPVLADIRFPNTNVKPKKTDNNGRFDVSFKKETVVLILSAQGYRTLEKEVFLKPGTTMNLLFTLTPENITLAGKVMDRDTGKPIQASILIDGEDTATFQVAANIEGYYSIYLNPGKYRLEATSEGYISAVKEVSIEEGKELWVNFLLSLGPTIPEAGFSLEEIESLRIKFAPGKSSLDYAAKEILDGIVLTLKHNPHLIIDITTLLPEESEVQRNLTKKRIESIKNYLISKGIPITQFKP